MSIKALPSMEHSFQIKVKGSETGQSFEGSFTYRRPNLRTKSEISKTAAILDGGLKNLDEDTQLLHGILARLKHTISASPEWWSKADFGFELYDVNVILEVYRACDEFEKKWIDQVWKGEEVSKDKK